MSSLFKGLADSLGPKPIALPSNNVPSSYDIVKIGQVLDVVLDASSELYVNDESIGIIRFRFIPGDYRLQESTIKKFAFPIDKLHYRVPLPGEQLLIYPVKFGDRIYYGYGQLVQQQYNNAFNSHPYIATAPKYIAQGTFDLLALTSEDEQSKRFIDKLQIPISYYEEASLHPPTAIREGDSIIQNRFGSQIRLTSTVEDTTVKALSSRQSTIGLDVITNDKASEDGDPIIILQANRLNATNLQRSYQKANSNLTGLDDVNVNGTDAIIYLTSTQAIPIDIACSRAMFSWNVDIVKVPDKNFVDLDTTTVSQLIPTKFDPNEQLSIETSQALLVNMGAMPGGNADSATVAGGSWAEVAANYISKKEGFTEVATWDENAYRGGYGSDTIYRNGKAEKVTQNTTFTRQEAIDTLREYSLPKFSEQIIKDLGQENWDKLNDNQKAALISLGYNVGRYYISARRYGKKIKKYIQEGNLQAAGETIYTDGPKSGAKSGPLPGLETRRREESQLFLS